MPPLPPPLGGSAAFFSCSAHQKAFEDAELKHGVFFHHVIEALKGDADSSTAKRAADGQITLAELSEHVSSATYDYVRVKFSGAKLASELKGEFRVNVPLIELPKAIRSKTKPETPSRRSTPPTVSDDLITNSIGMTLKRIPAGEFLMGSPDDEEGHQSDEGPQHRVRITEPYYLGIHEVTRGQFAAFVKDQNYQTEAERDGEGGWGWNETTGNFEGRDPRYNWKATGFAQADNHPVVNVSWNDAVAFCGWLSRTEGRVYRLPCEAEWEYACRAGTTSRYQTGTDAEELAKVGTIADGTAKAKFTDWTTISARDGFVFTAPVGRFRENSFGLYDMHGNAWEWCQDVYASDIYKSRGAVTQAPVAESGSGSSRVLRGGSWVADAIGARSANRYYDAPGSRDSSIGFRVVVE